MALILTAYGLVSCPSQVDEQKQPLEPHELLEIQDSPEFEVPEKPLGSSWADESVFHRGLELGLQFGLGPSLLIP